MRRKRKGQGGHPRPGGTNALRRELAWAAARLVADGAATDFAHAKLKAARQLGLKGTDDLPDDAEIEVFLRTQHGLFRAGEHHSWLRALRQTALAVMERLAPFNPRLRGSVLDGTASEASPIEIELFTDAAKEVELFLVNANIRYRPVAQPGHRESVVLVCTRDDLDVRLAIRPLLDLRKTERRAADGAPLARATIEALRSLLAMPDA